MAFLANLTQRDKQPEIMDQPGLEHSRHQTALRGLARINWISLSDRILWRSIERLARQNAKAKLRVLDIATGGGDVPVRLCQRARRAGLAIEFAGADINSTAIDCARACARRDGTDVEFFQLDALQQALPTGYDILTSSLFLHHLETPQAIELLQRMGQAAGTMVLINDLVRSRLGYLIAWIGTRVLSRSPVVHEDGPLSVRAAFTIVEARQLAEQAGLLGATVGWRWPFRFLLEWRRQARSQVSGVRSQFPDS
jgi:2-polyprenyl-3-methyl-5-hydroxy-6-metoxy-1,4-benzoquinol methylase